jgi:hypothetical protein
MLKMSSIYFRFLRLFFIDLLFWPQSLRKNESLGEEVRTHRKLIAEIYILRPELNLKNFHFQAWAYKMEQDGRSDILFLIFETPGSFKEDR